ncbi:MAG: hypothetical protein RLZZ401_170, partial [Pseudomonadota bacterium]
MQRMLALQVDSPLLVALFDAADQLQYANGAFRQAYGLASETLLTWSDLMLQNFERKVGTNIKTNDIQGWLASARSRRAKLPFRAFEADLCDGRWIWMTETVGADGWMLCVASDITQLRQGSRDLRQARDVAERAAQTDVLTGISNRAHIMQLLEQHTQQPSHQPRACGVALIDLDHFKRINDRFGHQGGDTVLRSFSATVQEVLRHGDGFGRMGGEEFLIVFPGIDAERLNLIMPRLLSAVRDSRPLPDCPDFSYTCSAGIGMLEPGESPAQVFRRVDEALYVAKAAGRDQ